MEELMPDAQVLISKKILRYRERVLLTALALEIKGYKKSRGKSVYSLVKKEYNLSGSRQSVYDQFKQLIEKR